MTREATEKLQGIVSNGILAALLIAIGAVGGTSLQGQTSQPPPVQIQAQPQQSEPKGMSAEALEERIAGKDAAMAERLDGRHELVMSRLGDVVTGLNAQVGAVSGIAANVGEIKGAVDKLVLNQSAMQVQMAARVEADRSQDDAIAALRREIADLQRLLEDRP
jgi:hypothetical protein